MRNTREPVDKLRANGLEPGNLDYVVRNTREPVDKLRANGLEPGNLDYVVRNTREPVDKLRANGLEHGVVQRFPKEELTRNGIKNPNRPTNRRYSKATCLVRSRKKTIAGMANIAERNRTARRYTTLGMAGIEVGY